MAAAEELPLYRKTYGLTKYLYTVVRSFPKEYKYSMGNDILFLSWRCIDLILEANAAPNAGKRGFIEGLDITYRKLKMRVRMAQEINIVSVGQFAHLQEMYLLEIGRMIGGWKRWIEKFPK